MPRLTDQRNPEKPEPGFYKVALVKRGPWIPAHIAFADGEYALTLNGIMSEPHANPWKVRHMEKVWFFGPRVTEQEYEQMQAASSAADSRQESLPSCEPINLRSLPSLW